MKRFLVTCLALAFVCLAATAIAAPTTGAPTMGYDDISSSTMTAPQFGGIASMVGLNSTSDKFGEMASSSTNDNVGWTGYKFKIFDSDLQSANTLETGDMQALIDMTRDVAQQQRSMQQLAAITTDYKTGDKIYDVDQMAQQPPDNMLQLATDFNHKFLALDEGMGSTASLQLQQPTSTLHSFDNMAGATGAYDLGHKPACVVIRLGIKPSVVSISNLADFDGSYTLADGSLLSGAEISTS